MRILLSTVLAASVMLSQGTARAEPLAWTAVQAVGTIIQFSEMLKDKDKVYYIRAKGIGNTESEARSQAYKKAVEYAVGVYYANNVEVSNGKVTANKSVVYSSGYVDSYRDVEVGQGYVILDVYVRSSKIAAGLLKEGKTAGVIDGDQVVAINETLLDSKQNGDAALEMVLSKFKQSAYIVTTGNYQMTMNNQRQAIIEIPYKVRWNYDYLVAMAQAAYMTQDPVKVSAPKKFLATFVDSMSGKNCEYNPDQCESERMKGDPRFLTVVANPNMAAGGSGKFRIGERSTFEFNDQVRWSMIANTLYGAQNFGIQLDVYNSSNRLVHSECMDNVYTNMISNGSKEVMLNGTASAEGKVRFAAPTKADSYTYKVKVFCGV